MGQVGDERGRQARHRAVPCVTLDEMHTIIMPHTVILCDDCVTHINNLLRSYRQCCRLLFFRSISMLLFSRILVEHFPVLVLVVGPCPWQQHCDVWRFSNSYFTIITPPIARPWNDSPGGAPGCHTTPLARRKSHGRDVCDCMYGQPAVCKPFSSYLCLSK